MNPNKALWEKGDFTRIASHMREAGDALVDSFGVVQGLKVLDLGCGDGTTALPAARRGADVTGIDIAANLVAAGRARAEAAGLGHIRFQEGDASHLEGIATGSFDLVVSIFGAMFAPNPYDVAKEMVRVTKPGGRIIMGNWIPNDPTLVAQILRISAAYTPAPPPGFVSPMLWGNEAEVIKRFTQAGAREADIGMVKESFVFAAKGPPTALLDEFLTFYGPTMTALDAARAAGNEAPFRQELAALFNDQNTSPEPGATRIAATFLRVSVSVG
jgi:ubiquinone/menaquinone biosynthesis C-methylase UbiE